VLTGDVTGIEVCSCVLNNVMYMPEDTVGLGVFTGTFPPSFDDACVVTVAFEVVGGAVEENEDTGEEFKGNCLCPPNVISLGLPVVNELPCMPMFSHNDVKAHS
jgi:hypothetical protein